MIFEDIRRRARRMRAVRGMRRRLAVALLQGEKDQIFRVGRTDNGRPSDMTTAPRRTGCENVKQARQKAAPASYSSLPCVKAV